MTPFFFNPFCQIIKAAIPIKIKSVVQTGAKSQLGGLNEGLVKEVYQVGIDGVVKKEPMTPDIKQTPTEMINFQKLLIFITEKNYNLFLGCLLKVLFLFIILSFV